MKFVDNTTTELDPYKLVKNEIFLLTSEKANETLIIYGKAEGPGVSIIGHKLKTTELKDLVELSKEEDKKTKITVMSLDKNSTVAYFSPKGFNDLIVMAYEHKSGDKVTLKMDEIMIKKKVLEYEKDKEEVEEIYDYEFFCKQRKKESVETNELVL